MKTQNHQNWENAKSEKVTKVKTQKVTKKVSKNEGGQKRPKCHLNGQNRHFAKSEPPGPGVFQSLGVPRDPVLRPKIAWGGSDGESWSHFSVFHFFIFIILSLFDILHFHDFVTFYVFIIFVILMILTFSWFLINFCCWHHFWSIFVSNLSAPMMTHFSPSKPALPLSPLLIVKLWPVFEHLFLVKFWSFFSHFLSIWVKKCVLPLRIVFFEWNSMSKSGHFWVIFGVILVTFRGVPIPVNKCPFGSQKVP